MVQRQPEHPQGAAHEKRLLSDLKLSASQTKGRSAAQIHLSKLDPKMRPEHALRAVESHFNGLVQREGVRIYWLRNFDLFVTFNSISADNIRSALVKSKFLFAGDPLVEATPPADGPDPLVSWFSFDKDFDDLLAAVRKMVSEHRGVSAPTRRRHRATGDIKESHREGAGLTPDILTRVEAALMRADLSSLIRRQAICAVVGRSAPDPVFTEVFVSIADLRAALIPHVELASNPWLFQHMTQTLDRRVLAMLTRRDDKTLASGFSLNLNIATILSEDFLKFDDSIAPGSHGTVVLELRPEDIFSDLQAFFFARDFTRQRGYRICIDGLTWRTLPFVDASRLGVDMVKLQWDDDLPLILQSKAGSRAAEAIKKSTQGRIILTRCDDEKAIETGQELGFSLFQGRILDKMMRTYLVM